MQWVRKFEEEGIDFLLSTKPGDFISIHRRMIRLKMKKIPFVKMHGLGNDFVIISEEQLPAGCNRKDFASMMKKV